MALSWEDSYLGQLRGLAGDDRTLMLVGARCVIRDEDGRLLLIKRSDNGWWAMPAGAMELGESMSECAIREVFEETGLTATEVVPCALYSSAGYTRTNMYGHTYQLVTMLFRVDRFHGDLLTVTDETTDAGFFGLDSLPEPLGESVRTSLADIAEFEKTGRLILR